MELEAGHNGCLMCRSPIQEQGVQLSNAVTAPDSRSAKLIKDITFQMAMDLRLIQDKAGNKIIKDEDNVRLCIGCVRLLVEYDDLKIRLHAIQESLRQGIEAFASMVAQTIIADDDDLETVAKESYSNCHFGPTDSMDTLACQIRSCKMVVQEIQDMRGEVIFKAQGQIDHLALEEEDERPYSCRKCGRRNFRSVEKLAYHSRLCQVQMGHKKEPVKPTLSRDHVCKICSKSFTKKSNLQCHLSVHSDEKAHPCPIESCGKKFKRDKSLKAHMSNTHSGSKEPLLCSFCGRPYSTLSGLKLHLAKHTGRDPKREKICSTCGKTFKCDADLKIHNVVHSKEKPFKCDQCAMAFTQKASLKDHQNVHKRIFVCSRCNNAFGRRRYLDQHVSTCSSILPPTTLRIDK